MKNSLISAPIFSTQTLSLHSHIFPLHLLISAFHPNFLPWWCKTHPTQLSLPLLALPIVWLRQGLSPEVGSSERQVQVVFVTSLDVSLNPFQSKWSNSRFPKVKPLIELFFAWLYIWRLIKDFLRLSKTSLSTFWVLSKTFRIRFWGLSKDFLKTFWWLSEGLFEDLFMAFCRFLIEFLMTI